MEKLFLKKNLLKNLLQSSIQMTDDGWKELNDRWIYFFIFLAILNETYLENPIRRISGYNLKFLELIPVTLVFAILQVSLIKKHRIQSIKLELIKNAKSFLQKLSLTKKNLQEILNLYARMVSMGEWKDYGIYHGKKYCKF